MIIIIIINETELCDGDGHGLLFYFLVSISQNIFEWLYMEQAGTGCKIINDD